jgi:hypothetical protein
MLKCTVTTLPLAKPSTVRGAIEMLDTLIGSTTGPKAAEGELSRVPPSNSLNHHGRIESLGVMSVLQRVRSKRRLLPGRKAAGCCIRTTVTAFRAGLRRVPQFGLGGEDIEICSRPKGKPKWAKTWSCSHVGPRS